MVSSNFSGKVVSLVKLKHFVKKFGQTVSDNIFIGGIDRRQIFLATAPISKSLLFLDGFKGRSVSSSDMEKALGEQQFFII